MAANQRSIKPSIAFWCFNLAGEHWDIEKTCAVAKQLGVGALELVDKEHWGLLKQHGLTCAMSPNGMPGAFFMRGFNNPAYHAELIARTRQAIDDSADAGFPNVIAFTGYKWRDADDPNSGEISLDEGAANCVAGLKQLASHAEKRGVTICLEQLSTRDDSHPLRGHPGYQGDDIDYVASIARQVASPNVKLSFDVYHIQVMNGDIIHRMVEYRDLLAHVQVAGAPGRGEIDDSQEINYAPIFRKLLELGYDGYVGLEFLPSGDAVAGLADAVDRCRSAAAR
jgi:sugar phosphate isomerase/epimerase